MKDKLIRRINIINAILLFGVIPFCFAALMHYSVKEDVDLWIYYLIVMFVQIITVMINTATIWSISNQIQKKFTFTCRRCGSKHTPTFWKWLIVPQVFSKRYLKCPECKKRSLMRRK